MAALFFVRSRQCSRIFGDQASGDEAEGGEESFAQYVAASSDAPEIFNSVEESLDRVALDKAKSANHLETDVRLQPRNPRQNP